MISGSNLPLSVAMKGCPIISHNTINRPWTIEKHTWLKDCSSPCHLPTKNIQPMPRADIWSGPHLCRWHGSCFYHIFPWAQVSHIVVVALQEGLGENCFSYPDMHTSSTIHVWYVYLHLVDVCGKRRYIYTIHGCYFVMFEFLLNFTQINVHKPSTGQQTTSLFHLYLVRCSKDLGFMIFVGASNTPVGPTTSVHPMGCFGRFLGENPYC